VSGSRGRASFEQKRRDVMNSPSHWVEIDLLRGGVPLGLRGTIPECEYFVHVSDRATRPKGKVWPIRLSQRLPRISIALRREDPEVGLDLQAVLDVAYDRAAYDLRIDYLRDPIPSLDYEWAEWADRLLREKGLRPS